jgi:hypothetical protein
MKIIDFLNVTSCGLVNVYRCLREILCPHEVEEQEYSSTLKMEAADSSEASLGV